MRLHKVYHRISLLSLSSSSSHFFCNQSLSSPSFLSFPASKLSACGTRLRHLRRTSSTASIHMSASARLRGLAPIEAVGGENSVPASNGSASSALDEDYADSALGGGYRLPPKEIRDIVDSPPVPALSFSPLRDKILFLKRRALPPLADLARPEEKLAGMRIDGKCNTRSRMSFYTAIGIHQLLDDGTLGPEKEIRGLPDGAKINFVTWSTNGQHLAFSVRLEEETGGSSMLTVWIADIETGKARPLFQSTDIHLNAVFENYVWVDESTLLVCTIPSSRGDPPKKPLVPSGPKIQSNEQKNVIQVRTFQDLLKDEYDEDLFDYYATSQLVLVSLDGSTKSFGPPAVYTSLDTSPDKKYVLISSLHRPYSYTVPCGRFPKKVDLWTTDGKFIRQLCDLPLAEDIPITHNSVRKGMRSINWRADRPSTLYWVETQDGGDSKVEVYPRDIVYTEPAEPTAGDKPAVLHKLDLRYGGVSWCDDSLALVYESWYKTRRTRTWVISPESEDVSPRILFDRSFEDVYSDPGSPMLRRNSSGTYVIAKIRKENDDATYLLLNGSGATPQGNVPFLDLFDINTGSKERIWESDKEKYFETVAALLSDQYEGDLSLNQLRILTSKESKTENTQYYLQTWPEKQACQITNFPHPYPQLASLHKEMIRYERKDGVQLTAFRYTFAIVGSMEGGAQYNPRTVEEVFKDFKARRSGLIKALTTDVDEFFQHCDPEKENLCLYGFPSGNWEVNLPAEEVPPELPEPALGINFARDGMKEQDWLSLVAVHSDAWLLSVAYYFGARFGFDRNDRKRLFNLINELPTLFEVVSGTAKKQVKEKSSNSNNASSKSKSSSKAQQSESQGKNSKATHKKEEHEGFLAEEEEDEEPGEVCGACGDNYGADEFWICCDICETWFHGKCVKISPAKAEHLKQYKCPSCTKKGRP